MRRRRTSALRALSLSGRLSVTTATPSSRLSTRSGEPGEPSDVAHRITRSSRRSRVRSSCPSFPSATMRRRSSGGRKASQPSVAVQVLGDPQADVEAHQVGELQRPHGMAVPQLHGAGRCPPRRATPSSTMRIASMPEHDAQARRGEPGRVLHDHRLLAEAAHEGDRGQAGGVRGVGAPHHLDQLHDVDGVEEVQAEEATRGPAIGARDALDRQRRGVRGQERVRGRRRVHLAEDLRLQLERLGRGLHHEVGVRHRVGDRRWWCARGRPALASLGRVDLPQLDALVEVRADARRAPSSRPPRPRRRAPTAHPAAGAHLRDAVAHGAGAQHGDPRDRSLALMRPPRASRCPGRRRCTSSPARAGRPAASSRAGA